MMMGRKDLEAAEVMVEHYGLEGRLDPAEFVKNRSKILEELFPDCEMMPGKNISFGWSQTVHILSRYVYRNQRKLPSDKVK